MVLIRLLGNNLLIGSSLTVLMMVLMMTSYAKGHQEYDNLDKLLENGLEETVRDKRSPCRSYGYGGGSYGYGGGGGGYDIGTGSGGGTGIGGNGIDLPIGDVDGDYLEIPVRRRGNNGRRRNNGRTTNRRRRIHNFKNNEVEVVQEEILTRRKRQAPDFGGEQMPGLGGTGGQQMPGLGGAGGQQMPGLGGAGGQQMPGLGGAGGGLKDKIKQIGSKMAEIGSNVRQKIKDKIGQLGKH